MKVGMSKVFMVKIALTLLGRHEWVSKKIRKDTPVTSNPLQNGLPWSFDSSLQPLSQHGQDKSAVGCKPTSARDSVPVLRSVSEPRDLVDAVHRSLLGVRGFLGHRIVERRVVLRPVSLPSVARRAAKQRK